MIFLRPWALALLIVPFMIKGFLHFTHSQSPWTKFIDKKLLSALLVKSKPSKQKRLWTSQIGLLWLLWTLALAGPAFNKLPTPAVESAPNTIIVFDLSMQGKELLQGQAKLYDLLTTLRGERVGLVVFGQNQGYTAMPLTPDIDLVKGVVPTLVPQVLPEPALTPKAGFEYATELLDNAGAKGRILYITDKPTVWQGKYPFGVLDLNKRTVDINDIKMLLNQTKKADATTTENTFSSQADVWADLGGWLVLISLPFFALMFRKGVLFLMVLGIGMQANAGIFLRPDQEQYALEEQAIQAYQEKDYQTAVSLFQRSGNLYNLGNALAFSGDIQGAINTYQEELKRNPENKDAQFNKEYLEKQIPPQENKQQENQSQNEEKNSDRNQDQQEEQNQQENPQQNSDKNTSKNQENESQKNASESQPTQEETQEELEQALAEYEQQTNPYNQEEQQIINRLNRDPSRVLRYRLYLQHHKGQTK